MIKILQDIIVKGQMIADSIKRSSDESEASYDPDMHNVSKTGDFNDLENKPDPIFTDHENDKHQDEFDTSLNVQSKVDTAEANAKTHMDNREQVIQSGIDETNNEIYKFEQETDHHRRVLQRYFTEIDIAGETGGDEPEFWYDPLV